MDIIIDQNTKNREIILASSKVFGLNSNQISVISEEIDEIDNGDDMIELFIEKEIVEGEFVNVLSLFPHSKNLKKQFENLESEIDIARQFCAVLKCRVLIHNDPDRQDYLLFDHNNNQANGSVVKVDFKNGVNWIV
jgi:hypothetical protein